MTTETLSFIFGGLLLLIGLLGGGFELKELKLPKVGWSTRIMAFMTGLIFMAIGVFQIHKSLLPNETAKKVEEHIDPEANRQSESDRRKLEEERQRVEKIKLEAEEKKRQADRELRLVQDTLRDIEKGRTQTEQDHQVNNTVEEMETIKGEQLKNVQQQTDEIRRQTEIELQRAEEERRALERELQEMKEEKLQAEMELSRLEDEEVYENDGFDFDSNNGIHGGWRVEWTTSGFYHTGEIIMNGVHGLATITYFDPTVGMNMSVDQDISLSTDQYGRTLVGSNPRISGTFFPHLTYSPDNFKLQQVSNNSVKITELCDQAGNCATVNSQFFPVY